MSEKHGDKARYGRERKKKNLRRKRVRDAQQVGEKTTRASIAVPK